MRNFARWFAAFLAIALVGTVPVLYRAKITNNEASHAAEKKRDPSRGMASFEDRPQLSQPVWLLVLGTGLILCADRLSKILRTRRHFLLGSGGRDNTLARGATHDSSGSALGLDAADLDKHEWQGVTTARSAVERTLS
jgi:hypothetical protein